jgi:hypothetical protein
MPRNHGNKQNTCVLMLVLGIYSVADFVVASVGLRHRSDKCPFWCGCSTLFPGHPLPDLGKQHQHPLFQFLLSFSHHYILRKLNSCIFLKTWILSAVILGTGDHKSSQATVNLVIMQHKSKMTIVQVIVA